MLKVLTQLIQSIKPRYLLYLYLVCSVLVAITEITILYVIHSLVNKISVNGDGQNQAVEAFLKFNFPNEYQNIFIIVLFLILISSKILSLWLLKKISYITDVNISKASIEDYFSPSRFEKLRKHGHQEFLAKNLTLPEDLNNLLLVSTLQLIPILATFLIFFIGLTFVFGEKIFIYLSVLVLFVFIIYAITNRIITKTTTQNINKRVIFLGALNQLWTVLPSITVMKNSSAIMEYLEDIILKKSSALATLRVIKMMPKIFYDNLVLLVLIIYCLLAGTLGWSLVIFTYGIVVVQRLTPHASGIVNVFSQYQSGLAVIERFTKNNEKVGSNFKPSNFEKLPQDTRGEINRQNQDKKEIISLKSVSVKFGESVVFEGFTESFYSSEIVVIRGPSGSGKSMLMETICGINTPSTGKVSLIQPETRISYIPQFPQLFHLKTENLAKMWLGKSKSTPLSNVDKNIFEALLERLGLLDEGINSDTIIGDTNHSLSGGQMMRLTICLALLRNPDLLVMDEPTASLDKISTNKFLQLLDQVCMEDGVSVITSTHDPILIQKATRVIDLA